MALIRKVRDKPQGEDPAGLAGWMFADLLLALTVIFLATISFVPISANGNAQIGPLVSFAIDHNTISLKDIDPKTVETAMAEYAKINHISKDFHVGSMTVLGGYNATKEGAVVGTATALKFATGISNLNLPYFKGTATELGASGVVSPGHVILNLTVDG